MRKGYALSRVRDNWEVQWVSHGIYGIPAKGPVTHAFLSTWSESNELLLRKNVSKKQIVKELLGLVDAINEGLLEDLEQEIPYHGRVDDFTG